MRKYLAFRENKIQEQISIKNSCQEELDTKEKKLT